MVTQEQCTSFESVLAYFTQTYQLTACHLEFVANEVKDVFDDFELSCYAGDNCMNPVAQYDLEDLSASMREIEEIYLMNMKYMLDELVGQGTYGTVYKAHHIQTGQVVAIKIIDIETSKDDIFVITNEILTIARMQGCPQLVSYVGSFSVEYSLWVITEYLDGGSVLDRTKRFRTLSEAEIAVVCREVLLGLFHLNRDGFIHRDIKAANILLSRNGRVKLADFGASGNITDTKTKCDTFLGTPYWIAPEVIADHVYDGKADVWSLGITCHEMLTGLPPRHSMNVFKLMQCIPRDPPPHLPHDGTFSPEFVDFVNSCLTKDPKQRPSVKQLLRHPFIANAGLLSLLAVDKEM